MAPKAMKASKAEVNAVKQFGRRAKAGVAKVKDEPNDDTEHVEAVGINPLWVVLPIKT
jgi:hypothetical protein